MKDWRWLFLLYILLLLSLAASSLKKVTLCQAYPWLQYAKVAILGGLILYCFAGMLSQIIREIKNIGRPKK